VRGPVFPPTYDAAVTHGGRRRRATAARFAAAWTVIAGAAVVGADPAAAHALGGSGLPAPAWMLAYGGAACVLIATLALRASASGLATGGHREEVVAAPADAAPGALGAVGRVLGTFLFVATVAVASTGAGSVAANVAPVAVLVVWWVGLPLLCLAVGDVVARINPFDAPVALVGRTTRGDTTRAPDLDAEAPSWTAAAFLGAFMWFLLAYHSPGSPRALAVFLVAYALAAIAGGLRWGRRWLRTGEGFGVLSAGVASVGLRRSTGARPPALAALAVVWLGGTIFDAVASTSWWADVVGHSTGWERTAIHTVGFGFFAAAVGGAYLATATAAERLAGHERGSAVVPLGGAVFVLALGWFVAHDLTLLLVEGQNFLVLASDPLARGWDLLGTGDWYLETGVLESPWLRLAQLVALLATHVGALAVARAVGARTSRRDAVSTMLPAAGLALVSIVVAVLLLLSGVDS
jgi:hypothetical protein